jgi:ketosteroid isomerase-like protein
MIRPTIATTLGALLLLAPCARAQSDDRAADRAAIRADVEAVFRAFIDKDAAALRATHAAGWTGFLEGSRTMIRGIDQYMKAVTPGTKSPYGMAAYQIRDFEIVFSGDAAFVTFLADTDVKTAFEPVHDVLRIADFYVKTNGKWVQSGSNTSMSPEALSHNLSTLQPLTPAERKQLLDARDAVWRAYFTTDRAALARLLPAELVVITPQGQFAARDAILAQSAPLAANGIRLARLEFPRTEIQLYGTSAFLYTTYEYDLEQNGATTSHSGTATEVFVYRDGAWVNPGWQLMPALVKQ